MDDYTTKTINPFTSTAIDRALNIRELKTRPNPPSGRRRSETSPSRTIRPSSREDPSVVLHRCRDQALPRLPWFRQGWRPSSETTVTDQRQKPASPRPGERPNLHGLKGAAATADAEPMSALAARLAALGTRVLAGRQPNV